MSIMNKFRVIRLAAYFLAVLFGGLLLYYLFSLGSNLHLSKAATKEVDKQIGNLLTLQAGKIDSLKIENKEGSIYLLNKGSTLNVSAKRQFSIKNDKKIAQALADTAAISHGVTWQLLQPNINSVDSEVISNILDALLDLPIYNVIMANGENELANYGLHQPLAYVRCRLTNRQEFSISIGRATGQNTDYFYLRFDNSNVVYTVDSKVKTFFLGKFALVNKHLNRMSGKEVDYLSFVRKPDDFYIDAAKETVKTDNTTEDLWLSYRPIYTVTKQEKIQAIVDALTSLHADTVVDEVADTADERDAQIEKYGFAQPLIRCRLGSLGHNNFWEITVGKAVADYYYVKTSASSYVYLLERGKLQRLLQNKHSYLAGKPFAFPYDNVKEISISNQNYTCSIIFPDLQSHSFYPDKAADLQLNFVNYNLIKEHSVVPQLPAADKQIVWNNYQRLLIQEVLKAKKDDKGFVMPQQVELQAHERYEKGNYTELPVKQNERLTDDLWLKSADIINLLQRIDIGDLAWKTSFLDNDSQAAYIIKYIFQDGHELKFTLHEANLGNYYLYINNQFTHYLISRNELKDENRQVDFAGELSNLVKISLARSKKIVGKNLG